MNSWDEVSLGIGLMGQMFLPLVKDESQRQPYLVAVGVNIIEVTTIGLFVAGILSFLKHAHDVEKEYESEAGKN